jgi:hypothetical protein
MSGFTSDSKCDVSPDGHHTWLAGTTEEIEVFPGIRRHCYVRVCIFCERREEL